MSDRSIAGPGIVVPSLALLALAAVTASAQPPGPSVVEALTTGVWHASVGEDDFLYELDFENGTFGGRLHRVNGGKQINEIPVEGVSLDGTAIQIRNRGFPPYRGRTNLERGRIEGGVAAELRFRDMPLTRVEAARWPMLRPRPAAALGRPTPVQARPEETDDGWPTASLAEAGIDRAAVEKTLEAIFAGEAAALHSLLIARDGRLVVEEYFHGWGRDDLHHLTSCTKSVGSLLVGIAIDQGHLSGVDAPLVDLFPELAGSTGRGWETVRVEHLLTMTMGLDWNKGEERRLAPPGNQYAQVLARNVTSPPGTRFRYGNRNVNLLSGVLLRATGVEADAFAQEHLFTPLGITAWDWDLHRWQGHPEMGAALKLRPRDMAKLGQLVLDEGLWQGRRVVSSSWIRESTRTQVADTAYGVDYGYLWWRVAPSDSPLGPIPFANGIGSQFIAVVPDARLVIVTTGGNSLNQRQFDIVRVAEQHLLPALAGGHPQVDRLGPLPDRPE